MDPFGLGPFLISWLEMAVRWFHVIAGIAWIGSSFYFIALDFSLKQRQGLPDQAYGEAWQVHGGGFYHLVKYLVAPARMPDELTWFKWESYATWFSGFFLLILVYYLNTSLYLIDPAVADLSGEQAIIYSVLGLAGGWLFYDLLCRSPLGRDVWMLGLIGFGGLVAASYGYSLLFSGRGAIMQMGALIGTIMAANVFMVIIPGQTKVVADLIAGRRPDPAIGARAKRRSLHNNYLTLPVVFTMVANHYPLIFANRLNWAILAVVLVLGALIRHFFNTRHQGKPSPWWTIVASAGGALIILILSWHGSNLPQLSFIHDPQSYALKQAAAHEVIATRCVVCHAASPAWAGLSGPPKGARFDTSELIEQHRHKIADWSVASHAMPPGNLTEITDGERAILAAWIATPDSQRNMP